VRPAMELGGNAPFMSAPMRHDEGRGGALTQDAQHGEACTAANRFYVHESSLRNSREARGEDVGAEDGQRPWTRRDGGSHDQCADAR